MTKVPHMGRTGGIETMAALIISIFGLFIVAGIMNQPRDVSYNASTGPYVWALFSALCVLGASATLLPHLCGHSDHKSQGLDKSRTSTLLGIRIVHGHHHLCEGFREHEFSIGDKTFCVGCIGLLIGASMAFVIATLYFLFGFVYPSPVAFIGMACVAIGLLAVPLPRAGASPLWIAFNAALVVGFALILSAVDQVNGLKLDLFIIGMCIFWMFTRIQLSRWNHTRICRSCGCRIECVR